MKQLEHITGRTRVQWRHYIRMLMKKVQYNPKITTSTLKVQLAVETKTKGNPENSRRVGKYKDKNMELRKTLFTNKKFVKK